MQPEYEAARLEYFQKALATSKMLAVNKSSIDDFLTDAALRCKIGRQRTLLDDLIWWADVIDKPFRECGEKDIKKALGTLNSCKNKNGQPYSGWSKRRKLFALKSLFRHMNGGNFPDSVKWIDHKVMNFDVTELQEKDIIEQDDLRQLLKACENEQEAAMLYVLWECGARASEFLDMKIEDIQDRRTHYLATLRTVKRRESRNIPKTRKFPLVESGKYLRAYLNKHPQRSNPKAALWLSNSQNRGEMPLTDRGLRFVVTSVAKRAKMKKPIWVHLFRHSCASRLAPRVTPVVLNRLLGWATASKMWNTYLHLKDEQSEDEVLRLYGVAKAESGKPEPIEMKKCPLCGFDNIISNILCDSCGRSLDTLGAIKLQQQFDKMQTRLERLEKKRGPAATAKAKTRAKEKLRALAATKRAKKR